PYSRPSPRARLVTPALLSPTPPHSPVPLPPPPPRRPLSLHAALPISMTDAALDREIARALAVDRSPEFAARVRQRIAGEPAPAGWRAAWIFAAGALAAGAVVLLVVTRDRDRAIETTPPMLAARASSGVGELPTGRARL